VFKLAHSSLTYAMIFPNNFISELSSTNKHNPTMLMKEQPFQPNVFNGA
jgi:hypothetical protein